MRTPQPLEAIDRSDAAVRTFDYGDRSLIAADFGAAAGEVSIDVVGDTVLVVAGEDQYEFELPEEAADVSANNGVLTISDAEAD